MPWFDSDRQVTYYLGRPSCGAGVAIFVCGKDLRMAGKAYGKTRAKAKKRKNA